MMKAYQHKTLEEQKERELQHYVEIMLSRGFQENSIKRRLQQEKWPSITLDKIFGRIRLHQKAEMKRPITHRIIMEKRKKTREDTMKKIAKAFEK